MSADVKEAAYKGLIRPILEYDSCVCDLQGMVLQEEIDKVQNRAARLCWGLTARPLLRFILCRLPEKGREEIEERVEEMKERVREERKMNDREETEEIKTLPLHPYLLQA